MIVCICKGLSEAQIRRVVSNGASTVTDVGRACGAGTDCGTCQDEIECVIAEVISASRLVESARHPGLFMQSSCPAQREAGHEGQRPGH